MTEKDLIRSIPVLLEKPFLEPGDILIDGGNSLYTDTVRRTAEAERRGLFYIGLGVSGGEEGARKGPSLMPGGSPEAWEAVRPVFRSICAKTEDGSPCCAWMGGQGSKVFRVRIPPGSSCSRRFSMIFGISVSFSRGTRRFLICGRPRFTALL